MTDYEAAVAKHNEAQRVYNSACRSYRAGAMDDAEFLALQGIYKAATAAFDTAYAKAAGWQ